MGSGSSVEDKAISFSSVRSNLSGRSSSDSRSARLSSSQSEKVVQYAEIIHNDIDSDYKADSTLWKVSLSSFLLVLY